MASKDKGGRAAKKPAAKDLKQKRLDKKAKKVVRERTRVALTQLPPGRRRDCYGMSPAPADETGIV
jgi:hypothetical protein